MLQGIEKAYAVMQYGSTKCIVQERPISEMKNAFEASGG